MNIALNNKGLAVVTAETMRESIRLQELFVENSAPKKYGRPIGSKNKRKGTWNGKHKKVCQFCGKFCKNLKLHMLQKHTEEYKKLYGDVTSTGKPIGDTYTWTRGRK